MKKFILTVFTLIMFCGSTNSVHAKRPTLDTIQFDGVSSDAELKSSGWSRQYWFKMYPVQAKSYWDAWDCKGQPCDTKRKANIRKKAALVKRPDVIRLGKRASNQGIVSPTTVAG